MSYPPISDYYGSSSGGQNNQRGYATAANSNNRSQHYQPQVRNVDDAQQNQYGSNTYGWPGQDQSGHMTTAQHTYANDAWQSRSNNSTAYNYQREHYAPADQTNTQAQSYPSRDPYNSQNTQALNSLAYASGLEPSASSNSSVRPPHAATLGGYKSSTTAHTSQARTASPANSGNRYSTAPGQATSSNSYQSRSDHSSSSVHNQNLALDAAAALAGAVRGIYPQANQQNSTSTASRASYSPMTGVSQPQKQHAAPKPVSAYSVGPPADQGHHTPSQSRPPASAPPSRARATPASESRKASQPDHQRGAQKVQPTARKQQQPVQSQSQQQIPTSNPQNISNLVNSTSEEPEPVYESVENQVPMPHYIDPTQVFNPYHREHERKKREAAEAEARRKAEAQKAEEQRLEEEKRKAAEDAAKKVSESTAMANSKSKITKKGPGNVNNTQNQNLNQPIQNTSAMPSDDGMAVEMQKMMAKMKELRSSNPTLFQKLWNDMRGGVPSTIPSAAPIAQSASPQATPVSLPVNPSQSTTPAKPRSRKSDNSGTEGPPLNGYKVVVEDNPEGLPDLGRFPAERRIRSTYVRQKADTTQAASLVLGVHDQVRVEQSVDNSAVDGQAQPAAQALPAVQTQQGASQARPAESNLAWPEPRRRAVAVAAVHYLKSIPENESVVIVAQEILAMLERNPSYLDVCTTLEARGLRFSRTAFARELLKTVPELQTPTSRSAPVVTEIAAIGSIPQSESPSLAITPAQPTATMHAAPQPLPNLHGNTFTDVTHLQPHPVFTGLSAIKTEQPKSSIKPPAKPTKARAPASSRPEPPLGSKEAAARKRDFAELIDLTAIGDDDNYVLPAKQPRLDESLTSTPDPFKQLEASVLTGWSVNPAEPLRFNPVPKLASQEHPIPKPYQKPMAYVPAYTQPRSNGFQQLERQQNNPKTRVLHAKKMNESEALQKLYYDPRTVARDLLIASGRSSSERPLNLHLAGLLDKFIGLDADVSTIDWDSIDPGGPPPPTVEYVDIPAVPPRFKLGERVRRKRAKLTDIEKTREPNEERRRPRIKSRSPVDSGTPALHPASSSQKYQDSTEQKLAHQKDRSKNRSSQNDARSSTPTSRKISIDVPNNSQRSSRSVSRQVVGPASKMEDSNTPGGRRRGRPPGSKNKNLSVAAMKQQAKSIIVTVPAEAPPEPILHSYKCRWVKCHAELHNLDTLRRHVLKVHHPDKSEIEKDGLVCWWKKCQHLELDGEGSVVPKHTFLADNDWAQHIEDDHLQPVALKYGDGPQTKHTGKQNQTEFDLSKFLYKPLVGPVTRTFSYADPQSVEAARTRYLADENGRATTPLVTFEGNLDRPLDAMVLTEVHPKDSHPDKHKADTAAQNAFMKAHGGKRDGRRAAEEVVRAMEVRKQKIGPGLDRGGCTLINEARRSTFTQAPGISRIVDADY